MLHVDVFLLSMTNITVKFKRPTKYMFRDFGGLSSYSYKPIALDAEYLPVCSD